MSLDDFRRLLCTVRHIILSAHRTDTFRVLNNSSQIRVVSVLRYLLLLTTCSLRHATKKIHRTTPRDAWEQRGGGGRFTNNQRPCSSTQNVQF